MDISDLGAASRPRCKVFRQAPDFLAERADLLTQRSEIHVESVDKARRFDRVDGSWIVPQRLGEHHTLPLRADAPGHGDDCGETGWTGSMG